VILLRRLLKKSDLDLETILRRIEDGEKITFRDREHEISFQEVREALSVGETRARKEKDIEEKSKLIKMMEKIRYHLDKQYNKLKNNIQLLKDKIDVKNKKIMTVFAGTNGSGKSTITQLVRHQIDKVIDIDIIMKTKNLPSEEARNFSLEVADRFMEKGINFSVETTLRTPHVLTQIKRARMFGYKVVVYYVGLMDVHLNVKRIQERVEKGGNDIPEEFVLSTYEKSIQNMNELIKEADRAIVIDNSGKQPISVARFKEGKMVYHIKGKYVDWIENNLEK
jgi:predicted ABC-type ATPase